MKDNVTLIIKWHDRMCMRELIEEFPDYRLDFTGEGAAIIHSQGCKDRRAEREAIRATKKLTVLDFKKVEQ
jgi:hypothetical protein